MHISVASLLCLGLVFGSCQARDHRQFLRELQRNIEDELAIEEFDGLMHELEKSGSCNNDNNTCSCCVTLHIQKTMKVCGIASFEGDTCVNFTVTLNGNVIMMAKITRIEHDIGGSVYCCRLLELVYCGKMVLEEMASIVNIGSSIQPICKDFQQRYKACVVFDKITIDLKDHKFSGCANMQMKKGPAVVKQFKLGCFELPPKQKYRLLENEIKGMH